MDLNKDEPGYLANADALRGLYGDAVIASRTPCGALSAGAVLEAVMRIEEKVDAVQQELEAMKYRAEGSEYLTVTEAAAKLRRSPHTIRRWLRDGRLYGAKATGNRRGRYLISREEIDALLPERESHG